MADIYSGGDATWTGKSDINDVYLIHSPLARETFVELTHSEKPYEVRISALHQALQGLAHFHRHGIMHRYIKPTNLMVVLYDPVHVIIIDYGNATFDQTSTDHYSGTIAYLAPEVLELKRHDGVGEPYNCRADIFGLGLSAYQLFFQASCKWKNGMDPDIHAKIILELQSRTGISRVIETMLAWESRSRPSSDDLLELTVWPKLRQNQSPQSSSTVKRSRQ